MSRIQVEAVSKRFGATVAVDHVSLDVRHGEFLVLLGPSGCGKSTLLRVIAGLIPLDAGRVLLDGEDITYTEPRDRNLAMVFQSYALYPHLSVERNIGFPLRARSTPRSEIRVRVAEVASLLGLSDLLQRRPRELSGGQRQRAALGRALVRNPGAFLMDEPLSNLDAKLRSVTRSELVAIHRRLNSTFVYVTHDQVEAMTMASRIAVLNEGRLEQVDTPASVYDEPASVFVAGFLGSPPMNLLDARIEARSGALHAVADGVDVPLGIEAVVPTREVVLGVRPEHVTLATGEVASFLGVVRLVENHGSEEVAHCEIGDVAGLVRIRGPRPLGVTIDQPVRLNVAPRHVHLFDRASGRRLSWLGSPMPSSNGRPDRPAPDRPALDRPTPSTPATH